MNEEMKTINFQTIVDGIQQFHHLSLIEKTEGLFVANPHADIPHQPALVQLDPTRIETLPDVPDSLNYRGVVLEVRTVPEE